MCYVDDTLAISHQADEILMQLGKMPRIKFKGDKIEVPDMCLGSRLVKKIINGHACWHVNKLDYLKTAATTIKESLKGTRWTMPSILNTSPCRLVK